MSIIGTAVGFPYVVTLFGDASDMVRSNLSTDIMVVRTNSFSALSSLLRCVAIPSLEVLM